jgi:hypothetical protein
MERSEQKDFHAGSPTGSLAGIKGSVTALAPPFPLAVDRRGTKVGSSMLDTLMRLVRSRRNGASRRFIGAIDMTLGTILLIVLVLLLIGAIPNWPYSSGWGYGPSGLLGTVLVVVLILVLLGRL